MIEAPVIVSGLSIMPVTQTLIFSRQNKVGISFFGFKRPLYVLIGNRELPIKAFTITGEAVSTEEIISDYPELKEALKRIFGMNDI